MPGLRKLFSSLTLGKKQDAQNGGPAEAPKEPPMLKRANAKLRKPKKTAVKINNFAGEEIVGVLAPSERRPSSSRIDSFEPRQDYLGFAEESRAAARLRHQYVEQRRNTLDGSMLSKLGLSVNEPLISAPRKVGQDGSMVSKLGLRNAIKSTPGAIHVGRKITRVETPIIYEPDDLRYFQFTRKAVPSTPNPFDEAAARRLSWDEARVEALNVDSVPDAGKENEEWPPACHGLPAIRDLDWVTLSEEKLKQIVQAYDAIRPWSPADNPLPSPASAQSASGPSSASPVDSLLAGSLAHAQQPAYFGKGKGRVIENGTLMGHRSSSVHWHSFKEEWQKMPAKQAEEALKHLSLDESTKRAWLNSREHHDARLKREVDNMQKLEDLCAQLAARTERLASRLPPVHQHMSGRQSAKTAIDEQSGEVIKHITNRVARHAHLDEATAREWAGTYNEQKEVELQHRPMLELGKREQAKALEAELLVSKGAARDYLLLREAEDRNQAEALKAQLLAEQEEARLAAERARLRSCNVCGDDKDIFLDFAIMAPTSRCEHPPTTCNECLENWMASEFDGKGTDGIKCPECSETLEYADVQRAASAETFEAFDKLATRLALGSLEDFAWCLKPNCGNGQLNPDNQNYMHCQHCNYKQCLKHNVAWHAGETCEAYEYRTSGRKAQDEERETEAMLDEVSKKCPGAGCGWRIQKTDGCDHMTCKKCKWEFCWQCLASQKEIKRVGNTAHSNDCKFHSHNLDVAWPFNVH